VGYALVVNYVGVYVLESAALAMIALVIAIEERELVNRFGHVYRDYQRDVPCALPRVRKTADRHERIS
jgi:protein-S-isoprenylcysteine O-methyltransferase Ste14